MSGGNRSAAVMARRVEPHDGLDYFPTPPWATRALCEWLNDQGYDLFDKVCLEPACGEMHMVRPLCEFFFSVRCGDVQAYEPMVDLEQIPRIDGPHLGDFLLTGRMEAPSDWVITNPPFNLAVDFIETALGIARVGVAMLVRTAFLESEGRVTGLFARTPPSDVIVFGERVVMLKGRLIRGGAPDPFATVPGTRASSATSYAWLVWRKDVGGHDGTRLRWFPPCRRRLERDGDYPDYGVGATLIADNVPGLLTLG